MLLDGLTRIEDKVIKGSMKLNQERLEYSLGGDAPTDIAWILSIMFIKRTMDMIWLKSDYEKLDEKEKKDRTKENCDAHNRLLDRYDKILQDLALTYKQK